MQLFDTAVIDAKSVRKTSGGFLVAHAKTARIGVQEYRARELGVTDGDPERIVRVERPAEVVFSDAAMRSMANKPMVRTHPKEDVNSKNWKRLATGDTGSEIIRDGDFIRHDLILMDAQAVADYEAGKLRGLSWGYSTEIEFRDGVNEKGEAYDAIMVTPPVYNHLATCYSGRGGGELRLGDDDEDDPQPGAKQMKTIFVDQIPVAEVSDAAEAVITRLTGKLTDAQTALTASEAKVGELTTTVSAKDGEIAVLKKNLEDAALTPDKLDQAVQARASIITTAKAYLGDSFDAKGKSDADIKKLVVAKKLDAATIAALDDAAMSGAFAALAASVPSKKVGAEDGVRQAVLAGDGQGEDDLEEAAAKARRDHLKRLGDAHQAGGTEH